jgi:hypothetical protein
MGKILTAMLPDGLPADAACVQAPAKGIPSTGVLINLLAH